MEAEIINQTHSCHNLFSIVNGVSIMGKVIGLPVGNTTIQVLIHKDNAGAFILAKPLPLLKPCIIVQRLFGFETRLWNVGLSCLRFLPLSNLVIYSRKDYLNQDLNISKR